MEFADTITPFPFGCVKRNIGGNHHGIQIITADIGELNADAHSDDQAFVSEVHPYIAHRFPKLVQKLK